MNVMQIGIVGVIGALLAIQFKGGKAEYGIFMSVAVSIFLFACIIDRLEIFLGTVQQIGSYINMDAGYLATMFKMIGVTYIAEHMGASSDTTPSASLSLSMPITSTTLP